LLFEADNLDVVTLLDVIEHMSDHEEVVDNVSYVLILSGRFVISTDLLVCVGSEAAGLIASGSRAFQRR
jgi:hypothetical protein